jgi:hypothetical protein
MGTLLSSDLVERCWRRVFGILEEVAMGVGNSGDLRSSEVSSFLRATGGGRSKTAS